MHSIISTSIFILIILKYYPCFLMYSITNITIKTNTSNVIFLIIQQKNYYYLNKSKTNVAVTFMFAIFFLLLSSNILFNLNWVVNCLCLHFNINQNTTIYAVFNVILLCCPLVDWDSKWGCDVLLNKNPILWN